VPRRPTSCSSRRANDPTTKPSASASTPSSEPSKSAARIITASNGSPSSDGHTCRRCACSIAVNRLVAATTTVAVSTIRASRTVSAT
jgi:hypothetical protein